MDRSMGGRHASVGLALGCGADETSIHRWCNAINSNCRSSIHKMLCLQTNNGSRSRGKKVPSPNLPHYGYSFGWQMNGRRCPAIHGRWRNAAGETCPAASRIQGAATGSGRRPDDGDFGCPPRPIFALFSLLKVVVSGSRQRRPLRQTHSIECNQGGPVVDVFFQFTAACPARPPHASRHPHKCLCPGSHVAVPVSGDGSGR